MARCDEKDVPGEQSDFESSSSVSTTRSRGSKYSQVPVPISSEALAQENGHNSEGTDSPQIEIVPLKVGGRMRLHHDLEDVAEVEVDSRKGWMVVAASHVSHFLFGFMFAMFGILYLEFTEHFHAEKGVVGWIGSLHISAFHFSGLVVSLLLVRYGCRIVCIAGFALAAVGYFISSFATHITVLYFTFAISGCGNGMVYLSSTVIVQRHFDKWRALAAGVTGVGVSTGTMASGPFLRWLLDHYHWQGTLLIISAIHLHGVAAGSLYHPPRRRSCRPTSTIKHANIIYRQEDEKSLQSDIAKHDKASVVYIPEEPPSSEPRSKPILWKRIAAEMFDFSLFRNSGFVFFCLTTFCMTLGMLPMYQHMPSKAILDGIEPHLAAWLPSAIGLATMTSRLVFSIFSNLSCANRVLQYGLGVFLGGVSAVLSVFANSFPSYVGFCLLYGLFNGSYLTIQPTVLVDLLGVENIARSQALLSLFWGVGCLLSVPFAGFLFDVTQNYDIPFYVLGGIQLFGGLLMLPVCTRKRAQ